MRDKNRIKISIKNDQRMNITQDKSVVTMYLLIGKKPHFLFNFVCDFIFVIFYLFLKVEECQPIFWWKLELHVDECASRGWRAYDMRCNPEASDLNKSQVERAYPKRARKI